MSIFDSHCHLYWNADDNSIESQIEAAENAGVSRFVCVGTNADTSMKSLNIAKQYSQVVASVGIHPNDVPDIAELSNDLQQISDLAKQHAWHAIGETGLDFFHKRGEPLAQEQSFLHHLDLAKELSLPVIIHCREAATELVTLLEKRNEPVCGVMHCFSEGPEFVQRLLDIGLHFSFAGNITYPKSDLIRESASLIPADKLLIETDAPFLAPQPMRGKKNQSAYIVHTLDVVASSRNVTANDIRRQIFDNSIKLFNL